MKEAREREGEKGECSGCPKTMSQAERGINPSDRCEVMLKRGGLCVPALLDVQALEGTRGLPVGFGFHATAALRSGRGLHSFS